MVEAGLTCSSISSALCDLHESWKLLPKTSEQRQHEGRVAKEGLKADDKSLNRSWMKCDGPIASETPL